MRKLIKSFLPLVLLIAFVLTVSAQEMTKEEKRAHQKAVRSLLKETADLLKDNNFDQASVLTDSLLVIDPGNADGYYNKGLILLNNSDSANALAALNEGSKLAPLSTRIKILLARLKLKTDDIDGAGADLDFILSIKPHESEALYLRGLVHQKKNETAEALERFKKALDSFYAKGTN